MNHKDVVIPRENCPAIVVHETSSKRYFADSVGKRRQLFGRYVLIYHRWRQNPARLAELKASGFRCRIRNDDGTDSAIDKPCIPAEAVESAFIAASKTSRKGKQAKAGFSCAVSPYLEYDAPVDLSSF